jgi:hypothetical protein
VRQTENAKNSKNKIFQKKRTANVKYPCLFSVFISNRLYGLHPLKIIERRTNMEDNMAVMPEIPYDQIGKAALIWLLLKIIF